MTLLIIIAIVVVVAIGVFVGLIFKSSVSPKQSESAPDKKPHLDAKQSGKLADARREITAGKQWVMRVQDEEIANTADRALAKAESIVSVMRDQPDEIRRASQFFGYYLPTMTSVLKKYAELEKSGTDVTQQKETVMSYLADITKAFDAAYVNMFKDEKMNLEVETEAMQMALKRDGLL